MTEQNIRPGNPYLNGEQNVQTSLNYPGYQGPRNDGQWSNQEPYPPRSYEERRLTDILERIERRLIAIEEKLQRS